MKKLMLAAFVVIGLIGAESANAATYVRFTITARYVRPGMTEATLMTLSELALYDADHNRLNSGMTVKATTDVTTLAVNQVMHTGNGSVGKSENLLFDNALGTK